MTAVGKLAAKPDQDFEDEAFTKQFVMDKLVHHREVFLQRKAGVVNTPAMSDIRRSLDTWLDEYGGLTEIRWITGDESEWRRHAE